GKLFKTPLPAMNELRDGTAPEDGTLPAFCELEVSFPNGAEEMSDLNLFTKEDGSGGFTIHYCPKCKKMTVSKAGLDKRFNENVFEELDVPMETPLRNMRVFIDRCSVELFINDGDKTFTAHVYPTEREHFYTKSDNVDMTIWNLKPSVKDDFVV
ncbi:MAG: GH32 C-terminal domain-containing protein, partial [Clostridia bacterium]|nr:GH32 C-terminal domain-containing protein [Clostridia bacterium]